MPGRLQLGGVTQHSTRSQSFLEHWRGRAAASRLSVRPGTNLHSFCYLKPHCHCKLFTVLGLLLLSDCPVLKDFSDLQHQHTKPTLILSDVSKASLSITDATVCSFQDHIHFQNLDRNTKCIDVRLKINTWKKAHSSESIIMIQQTWIQNVTIFGGN